MRRDDLDRLAAELATARGEGEPAITITLPTHRHGPDNAQDPIRVRQLARQAAGSLDQLTLSRENRAALDQRLERLEADVDSQVGFHATDLGLACYVTPSTTRVVKLGHAPPERVIVSDEFSLAAPIADVVTADDIDVLVLSTGGGATEGARLYHVEGGGITAHSDDVLPASFDVRDRDTRFSEERVESPQRDAYIAGFLRSVDEHLLQLFGNPHDRQLVVAGIERLRSHWRSVAHDTNRRAVVAELDGNFDRTSEPELMARAVEAVAAARVAAAQEAIGELAAAPRGRVAGGIDDVSQLAAQGRIAKLLVEEGATDEVTVDGVVIADRVSRTIRAAYDTQADIVIPPAGALGDYDGVAAFTRW